MNQETKLSEQLKMDHESGDFGNALKGYSERAAMLEANLAEEQRDYKAVEAMLHVERDASQKLRQDLLTSYGESEGLSLKVAEQAAVIEKLLEAIDLRCTTKKDEK